MKAIVAAALMAALPAMAHASRRSDLRDYALAACLIKQPASHDLQAEGYHLADIVINRAGIDPFAWKPLQTAVEAVFARRGMEMVHVDGPVAQSTRPAPLASCLLVIDAPSVQRVMDRLAHTGRH